MLREEMWYDQGYERFDPPQAVSQAEPLPTAHAHTSEAPPGAFVPTLEEESLPAVHEKAPEAPESFIPEGEEDVPPPAPPKVGFLVAAVDAPAGFGGFIPEEGDGPPSTDSDDDDVVRDVLSWSFAGKGKGKETREASFRHRSTEKIERATSIKATSAELTSHLVTPAQHNRRLELSGAGPRTVGWTPRTLKQEAMPIPTFEETTTRKKAPDRKRNLDRLAALAKS